MNSASIYFCALVCIVPLILLTTCAKAKEFELPPCESIPTSLCRDIRIRRACWKKCYSAFGNEEGLVTEDVDTGEESEQTTKTSKLTPKPNNVRRNYLSVTPVEKASTSEPDLTDYDKEEIDEFFKSTSTATKTTTKVTVTTAKQRLSTAKPIIQKQSTCDKVHPCIKIEEANQRFLLQCEESDPPVKPSCHKYCRYDVSFDELKNAFIRGACPLSQTRLYLQAASAGNNNKYCCKKTGVLSGYNNICFPFCNPEGNVWPSGGDTLKYLPCLGSLVQIMRCHWASLQ